MLLFLLGLGLGLREAALLVRVDLDVQDKCCLKNGGGKSETPPLISLVWMTGKCYPSDGGGFPSPCVREFPPHV